METFTEWTEEILPEKLRQELRDTYGEAPGEYMGVEKEGRKYIAVARIVFGNVAILPQPLPARTRKKSCTAWRELPPIPT